MSPHLLHAHYATGYGLLARLSGFRPLLTSIWGTDVYDFPAISPLHRWLLRGNLAAATAIASTSQCMARQAARTSTIPTCSSPPSESTNGALLLDRASGPAAWWSAR